MGVAEAALKLGVSPRRVRQMLASGKLSGQRIGRVWAIERRAVEFLAAHPRGVGRPWRAESAWRLLALADGEDIEASATDIMRCRRRLAEGLDKHLARLGARAELQRFYAHPSAVEQIGHWPNFVRSGVSAAAEYSLDVIAPRVIEGYVRSSELSEVVRFFGLEAASDQPNAFLRVVRDDIWPFSPGQVVAPPPTVAIDLLEADDERTRRSGAELLCRL